MRLIISVLGARSKQTDRVGTDRESLYETLETLSKEREKNLFVNKKKVQQIERSKKFVSLSDSL